MSASVIMPPRAPGVSTGLRSSRLRGAVLLAACGALSACGAGTPAPQSEQAAPGAADAPLVAAQPGAWFDAQGNLTVVGPGRRLRLVLSAPITACAPAFDDPGSPQEVATRASLPFHVLAEACRDSHPTILLAAESETASPSELERSYHEVARCAASELNVTEGWLPRLLAETDPCPAALGFGWRLPTPAELQGLTLDDRKAIAGALFDTEGGATFGSLLLYARAAGSPLELATLSPNAAERAPALDQANLGKPLFGAALRCVRASSPPGAASAPLPVLPHAASCLREQRQAQGGIASGPAPAPLPEVQKLKAWVDLAHTTPVLLNSESQIRDLAQLLAAPALDNLAREARAERALTERYAELAEGLDDPSASPSERERRRAEFDNLRRRLGGQIVNRAATSGAARSELTAVLHRLEMMLEKQQLNSAKRGKKLAPVDYAPLLKRVRELDGKAPSP